MDFDSQQLKQIFAKSGIDPKGNLFLMENGNTSWRYSIYVLGGLALPFETGYHKFLKELCRIYYGEDGDVDQLGEKERATAFKESVRSFGCLYEFIQTVLGYLKSGKSGDAPFAAEDLTDAGSWENRFVAQIRSANDAVLKSKFALEWVIGFEPEAEYMTRKLRLILKPESLGGLNHQYLKFERVRLWGIAHPENVKRLAVGVRFLQDATVVSEPDFGHPVLEYSTTGNVTTGDKKFTDFTLDTGKLTYALRDDRLVYDFLTDRRVKDVKGQKTAIALTEERKCEYMRNLATVVAGFDDIDYDSCSELAGKLVTACVDYLAAKLDAANLDNCMRNNVHTLAEGIRLQLLEHAEYASGDEHVHVQSGAFVLKANALSIDPDETPRPFDVEVSKGERSKIRSMVLLKKEAALKWCHYANEGLSGMEKRWRYLLIPDTAINDSLEIVQAVKDYESA